MLIVSATTALAYVCGRALPFNILNFVSVKMKVLAGFL
jgi:hypothetical protein